MRSSALAGPFWSSASTNTRLFTGALSDWQLSSWDCSPLCLARSFGTLRLVLGHEQSNHSFPDLCRTLASALAIVCYGFDLLSPLTPSHGTPSFTKLAIFVGVPLVVLGSGSGLVRTFPLRLIHATEALGIIAFSSWLLWLQAGTT